MPLCTIYRDRIQARTLASDHRRNGSSRPVALVHLDSLLAPHEIQIFFFERILYGDTVRHTSSPKRTHHITFVRWHSFDPQHGVMNQNVCSTFSQRLPVFFPRFSHQTFPTGQDLGVRLDQVPSFAKGLEQHGELPFWMCPVRWGHPVAGISQGDSRGITIPYHTAINPMSIHQLGYHLYISLQLSYNDLITWNCTPKYPLPCLFRLLDAVRPCCSTISRWLGAFRSTEVARLC